MKAKKNTKETVKEILSQLETGIESLKDSDKYKDFLKCMSKFHHYSVNNALLIMLQRPDATYVAGFSSWKNHFHRTVKKGEKGIRILVPAPVKMKKTEEKQDENGNMVKEEVEYTANFFKPAYVWDISQTVGEPLKEMPIQRLKEDVKDFELLKEALVSISTVPIKEELLTGEKNGYFSPKDQEIVIDRDLSESQMIKTLIHEIAHSRLHDNTKGEVKKDRNTKEVEAESIAFTVSNYFGINTDSYSFGYILGWSKSLELNELKESLETIRQTSEELISELSEALVSQREKQTIKEPKSIKKRLTEAKKAQEEQVTHKAKIKEAMLA